MESDRNLEYAFIIRIISTNKKYYNKLFFVDFIDRTHVSLISSISKELLHLKITPEGYFEDSSITNIEIVNIPIKRGYASFHGLEKGIFVDITFNASLPFIYTGEIISKNQDMIEIKEYDTERIIYLNFNYQGLKPEYNIKYIEIRKNPAIELNVDIEDVDEEDELFMALTSEEKQQIRSKQQKTDNFVEGEIIDDDDYVEEALYDSDNTILTYSVEQQMNTLLKSLMSNVELNSLDNRELKDIKKQILRFKELREKYTKIKNNTLSVTKLSNNPLLDNVKNGDFINLFLPICKNVKHKFYSETSEINSQLSYIKSIEDELYTSNDYSFFLKLRDSIYGEVEDFIETLNTNQSDITYEVYSKKIEEFLLSYRMNFTKEQNQRRFKLHKPTQCLLSSNDEDELLHYYGIKGVESKKIRPTLDRNEIFEHYLTKDIIVDSFMTYTLGYILYKQSFVKSKLLSEKCSFNKLHYYLNITQTDNTVEYNTVSNDSEKIKPCDLFKKNTYHANNENDFDEYINKIIPSYEDYVKCYMDTNITSMYDGIKKLNGIHILEINKKQYNLLRSIIRENIKKLVSIIKENVNDYKSKINNDVNQENENVNAMYEKSDVIEKLKILYNVPNELKYDGEIFNYSLLDLHALLISELKKTNPITSINSEDEDVKELIRQAEEYKPTKNTNASKIIVKTYPTKESLDSEDKKIILKDMANGNSSYSQLWLNFTQDKTSNIPQPLFTEKIIQIQKRGLNPSNYDNDFGLPAEILTYVLEKVNDIRVKRGELAKTEDDGELYYYDGQSWIPKKTYEKEFLKNRKLRFNGSNEDFELLREDIMQNNIIVMMEDILSKKENENESRELDFSVRRSKLLDEYKNTKRINNQYKARFNTEKINYEKKYSIKYGEIIPDVSKFNYILEKILSMDDLKLKYEYVLRFVQKFTKQGFDDKWLYCIESNLKLIPKFFYILANAYLFNNNYKEELEKICKEEGTISDSGEHWVHKHSGYIIKNIGFIDSDDYDTNGFKIVSKVKYDKEDYEYSTKTEEDSYKLRHLTKKEKTIYYAMNSLCNHIGYILPHEKIEEMIKVFVPYCEKLANDKIATLDTSDKSKKQIDALRLDKMYMYCIFSIIAFVLAEIQTSVPEPLITKTFPGCSTSFEGYPFGDKSDNTNGLKYLSCVVNQMKQKYEPWHVLMDVKINGDVILSQTESFIKKKLLTIPYFKEKKYIKKQTLKKLKIQEKGKQNDTDDSSFWFNFKPPLRAINKPVVRDRLKPLEYYKFKDSQNSESHNIIYEIQSCIYNEEPLLVTRSFEPFLVNACCYGINNPLDYFIEKTNIEENLNLLAKMDTLERDYKNKMKNPIYYIKENTKTKEIDYIHKYEDETIFQGLIYWFKLQSKHPRISLLQDYNIELPSNEILKTVDELGLIDTDDDIAEFLIIRKKIEIIKDFYKDKPVEINEDFFIQTLEKHFRQIHPRKSSYENSIGIGEDDDLNILIETIKTENEEELLRTIDTYISSYKRDLKGELGSEEVYSELEKYLDSLENFLSNNIPAFVTNDIEFYGNMNLILKNKIRFLLYKIPNKTLFKNNKNVNFEHNGKTSKTCKQWDLNTNHYNMIDSSIYNSHLYLKNVYTYNHLAELFKTLDLGKYKQLLEYKFDNPIVCFMMYICLIHKILVEFCFIKDKKSQNYRADNIISLFNGIVETLKKEDEYLNYDDELIQKKKSNYSRMEKDLITKNLKEMGNDARQIENELKEHRIGKWSVGLDKSMYVYSKDNFDNEIDESKRIIEAMSEDTGYMNETMNVYFNENPDIVDQYLEEFLVAEDDDVPENLDGDEFY